MLFLVDGGGGGAGDGDDGVFLIHSVSIIALLFACFLFSCIIFSRPSFLYYVSARTREWHQVGLLCLRGALCVSDPQFGRQGV